MKGKVCETEYIFSYTICLLWLTFFYGEGEEREVSACGNLCANKHKDQKSPSTTPKLRHLLYKGKSHESKYDKKYFCVCCFVKILSLLQLKTIFLLMQYNQAIYLILQLNCITKYHIYEKVLVRNIFSVLFYMSKYSLLFSSNLVIFKITNPQKNFKNTMNTHIFFV